MNAVIIGGGQTGVYIAKLLIDAHCQVRVIERQSSRLEAVHKELPEGVFIAGDGTNPNTMEQAGIETADVVAAVTGLDEVNLVAATIAKYEFGVPRVIGLVNHPRNEWLFTKEMGVDIYVSEASLLARLIVDEIDLPSMVTMMTMHRGSHSIARFTVMDGAFADGKAVRELQVPQDSVLIAVQREGSLNVTRGDTVIHAGDGVLALTTKASQKTLDSMFMQK